MIKRLFLLLMAFITCAGLLQARQVVLTDNGKPVKVANPYYLEDRSGNLRFDQVLQLQDSFVRSRLTVPDFLGNLSKAIWYKFEVINQSHVDDWFLEIKGGFFHRARLYMPDQKEVVSPQELTADGDFEKRPIKSNDLVFRIPVKPGQKLTAYLRVDSKTLIRASMKMKTMQQLYETSILSNFGYGFMTAVAAALLLYNLFVFFSLRERVYLHYCLYIFLYIVHNSFVSGYLLMFFPWTSFINSTLWLPFMGLASIIFTNSFLQTSRYAPFIYRIRWIMVSLFIIPLTMYFMGNYQLAISVIGLVMYGLFFYWIAAGIIAYRNSFKPAAYFIAGFGALIVLNTFFGLKIMGVLEENYWLDSALYIGTALEAIILSFALATKINFYKKEKELIQEQAYRQAVNFSRELIHMQETERKRIASELHDSVGQQLIVIKNKVLLAEKSGNSANSAEGLSGKVSDVIQEIRSISYGLRPYQMDLLGLTQSVKSLAEEVFDAAGIDHKVYADNIDALLAPDMEMNIYRIIQECFNNIAKHSRALECMVNIRKEEKRITIMITDNGIGISKDGWLKGFGLRGMQERLHILNGTMSNCKVEPTGNTTIITFPISVKSE